MMQAPRVYGLNEAISLTLPARLVQVILEVFHKCPNLGLPFDLIGELITEVETQCQPPAVPQSIPPEQMSTQPVSRLRPADRYDGPNNAA